MGQINQQKQGSSSTQNQTSNVQRQYDFLKAPDNPYFKNAESYIGNYDGGAAQAREAYSRNKNDIANSGNEIFGASTPDYARDAVRDSRQFGNNMQLGRDLMGAGQNEAQFKNNAYMSLGAATQPQLVETGSTANSTGNYSGTGTFTPGALDTLGTLAGIGGNGIAGA